MDEDRIVAVQESSTEPKVHPGDRGRLVTRAHGGAHICGEETLRYWIESFTSILVS